MTIRMLKPFNGLFEGQIVSWLAQAEETRLIGLGLAVADLDGPRENFGAVTAVADPLTGEVTGLLGPNGQQIPLGGGAVAPIQVTASRLLTSADNGATLYSSGASAFTLTLATGLPAGFGCTLLQQGSGALSVAAGTATLTNSGSTTGANTALGIVNAGADTYTLALPLSSSPYVYTGSWAGRPVAALNVGDMAHITDWPATGGGSQWRWDGTYWRPMGGRVTLYALGANIVVAAPTVSAETQALSVLIPAKMIPPWGVLRWVMAADKLNTTTLSGKVTARLGFNNSSADAALGQLVLTTTQVSGSGLNEAKRVSNTSVLRLGGGQANTNSPATSVIGQARGGGGSVADMDASGNYFTLGLDIATAAGTEQMVLHGFILELFA